MGPAPMMANRLCCFWGSVTKGLQGADNQCGLANTTLL
jgi:hypothetical protein